MYLRNLHLENFRNHRLLDIEFPGSDPLVITGKNGEGKTNILEAIFLLALTKSFRATKLETLIQWGKDFVRASAALATPAVSTSSDGHAEGSRTVSSDPADFEEMQLEYCLVKSPKKQKVFKRNDVAVPREQFLGSLRVVLFRPEDINMLILEPSLRRQFLNTIFIQKDPLGLQTLQLYQQALMQRNALLQSRNFSALDIWNEKLAQEGEKIQAARAAFVEFLQSQLEAPYTVHYSASRPLKTALEESIDRDIRFATTTVGPHREDLTFLYNGHPIANSASRGELRRLMMKLKKAEIDWLTHTSAVSTKAANVPMILLDDIFSELDTEGKEDILKLLPDTQVIMTIPEGNPIPESLRSRMQSCLKLHQGTLKGI